jgi:hypothetical protein
MTPSGDPAIFCKELSGTIYDRISRPHDSPIISAISSGYQDDPQSLPEDFDAESK